MAYCFRWNQWNLEHATRHEVSVEEAEAVVRRGRPRRVGKGRYQVIARGVGDRWIQVIYIIDPDQTLYIIHARPLTAAEKRRSRRRNRP